MPIDPVGQGGGASNLRVVDIERVEVLRGPQGTLFGSGSLAGAIRYITNKPDLTQFSGTAASRVADRNRERLIHCLLMLNAPIVQDELGVRMAAYTMTMAAGSPTCAAVETDANPTKTYGTRLSIAAKPDDQFSANLTLTYQDSKDYNGNLTAA